MERNLRILLADDHAVVREGLKRLIESEPDMDVIANAGNGREAVEQTKALLPDVAVLDVSMPQLNGAQAAAQIKGTCPQVKVLALTVHEDRTYVRELLAAGAVGYVLKRAAADELIRAIRTVAAGGIYVDPHVAGKLMESWTQAKSTAASPISELSERERDVLRLIAQGYSNKEIAGDLQLSVKTVETYKARGMEKLALSSRVELVRHAANCGWLQHN